jgi:hypothetical protein
MVVMQMHMRDAEENFRAEIAAGDVAGAMYYLQWDAWGDIKETRDYALSIINQTYAEHPELQRDFENWMAGALQTRSVPEAHEALLDSPLATPEAQQRALDGIVYYMERTPSFRDENIAQIERIVARGNIPAAQLDELSNRYREYFTRDGRTIYSPQNEVIQSTLRGIRDDVAQPAMSERDFERQFLSNEANVRELEFLTEVLGKDRDRRRIDIDGTLDSHSERDAVRDVIARYGRDNGEARVLDQETLDAMRDAAGALIRNGTLASDERYAEAQTNLPTIVDQERNNGRG